MVEVIFTFLGGLSGFIVFSFWWYKGINFLEKIYNDRKEEE